MTSDQEAASTTGWFWLPLKTAWVHYGVVFLCGALVNVFALAFPFFTIAIYSRVLPSSAMSSLSALGAGMLLIIAFDAVIAMIRSGLIGAIMRRAGAGIDESVFEHLVGLKLEDATRLAARVPHDISELAELRTVIYASLPLAVVDLLFSALFLAAIALIAGWIAAIPATGVAIILLVGLLLQFPARRAAVAAQSAAAQRQSLVVETTAAFELIKLWGGERVLASRWRHATEEAVFTSERHRFWVDATSRAQGTLQRFLLLAVIVASAIAAIEGGVAGVSIIAIMMLSSRAVAPAANLSGLLVRATRSRAALKALGSLMALEPEADRRDFEPKRPPRGGGVGFSHVTFYYPGAAVPALTDVNFELEPGARLGLVGRAGSGKTTLLRLLAGLYGQFDGSVRMGGVDVRQLHPRTLRSMIGFLPQDYRLLKGSLYDNLVLGLQDPERDAILEAAAIAGVDDFARLHPSGYDMPVSDSGANLSNGQRQAVALARALATRADLLVLDEPTSALDNVAENRLVERLAGFLDARQTLILVSHRRAALSLTDRLIVMDAGRIVSDGHRDALVRAGARSQETFTSETVADTTGPG